MHPANLLVLDEPTNHLDLDSKDVLLEALKNFPGTVIFVSHDKFFIDSLAEEVLELSCGKEPRLYNGNYAYYIEKKAILDGNENSEDVEQKKESVQSGSRQYRELEKQKKADQRRLQRREEELVTAIGVEEEKLTELHNSLSLPVNYSDGAKAKALQEAIAACESTITILHNEWEAVTTELARYSS
jgi:ATP-binding cassette subfamily F protein 3